MSQNAQVQDNGFAGMVTVTEPTKTVLVVDDDEAILRTFTRILSKAGYATDTAENGKVALEKIKVRSYDAALVDVVLGDGNGIDLLPAIKKYSPKALKVTVTGADSREKRDEACHNGADVYLTKPVNPATLLSILQKELKRR